ncbi:MAG: DUF3391 domain-containing protein [Candidatus Lambdaproteobacteria bacterium]|nr:DUF3391 domain-containing protein [Candidatus Lambdaproteobacteria bacterium]
MLRKIKVDQLRPGMFIERLDRHWLSVPVFRPLITGERQVQQLKSYKVREVYINTDKGLDLPASERPKAPPEPQAAAPSPHPPAVDPVAYFDEVPTAERIHDRALQHIGTLMSAVREGKALPLEPVQESIDEIIASIVRNRDALHSLLHLKTHSESAFRHSMSVAILSLLLGYHIGLSRLDLEILGTGAALHDIGKMRLMKALLEKTGELTPEEYQTYKTHALEGAKILDGYKEIKRQSLMILLHHHERGDGSGFPQGLVAEEIAPLAKPVMIADTFDKLTNGDTEKGHLSPYEAMDWIRKWGSQEFGPDLVQAFEEAFGLYPVGSFVRLSDNRLGLVLSIHHSPRLLPQVWIVFDALHQLVPPGEIVDLAQQEGENPLSITAALRPESFGFDLPGYIRETAPFLGERGRAVSAR